MDIYRKYLGNERAKQLNKIKADHSARKESQLVARLLNTDGGPGSGNWGHKGVEGQRGGSAKGTGYKKGTKDYKPTFTKKQRKAESAKLKHGTGSTMTHGKMKGDCLSKHTDSKGKLTPEREAMHEDIVLSHLKNAKKPDGQATFTFLGGGPASGKSTILKKGLAKLPDGCVKVDSDEIKSKIPEYQERVAAGDASGAAYVHEESSAISKRITSVASENGYNVALDGTGDGSVESMRKKIRQARVHGMRTEGIYCTCSTDEAVRRSTARAKKTGREVPLDRVKKIHRSVSHILPQIATEFDSCKLYDNTGEPKLVMSSEDGKITIHDKKLWKEFLNKAK